jgi:hypothetical protein
MKKIQLLSLFLITTVFGETQSRSLWDYHPLHVGGNTIYISGAEVQPRKGHQKGDLHFSKSNAFVFMLLPINEKSYFFPRVEWNTFTLDWDKNPKFNQTQFNYAQFGLTFFTTALDQWRWILRADYNLDTKHFSEPGLYGLTTGLLWGSYQIHRKWHYHIGATGYAGMEGATVYPIIGADYAFNKKWTIQAIFPILYAVEYQLKDWCRLSLKGRPLRERFRVGENEPQPQSIFNYSSMGAEFNVFMKKKNRLEVELYAGYNLGGSFYIKNKHGKHAYYTDLGGAPYVGANLDFAF